MPFGEELFAGTGGRTTAQGYSGDNVRQKFTSKERDNETGLDYFLARYYSSTQGRFTSPDEFKGGPDELFDFTEDAAENPTFYADLEEPQSLNKYQYCYNNPLAYVDPDGHAASDRSPTGHRDEKGADTIIEGWREAKARHSDYYQGLTQRRPMPPRRGGSGGGRRGAGRDLPPGWVVERDARGRSRLRYFPGGATWRDLTGRPPRPVFRNLKDHAKRHSELPPWQYYEEANMHARISQWKMRFYHNGQRKVAHVTQLGEDHYLFTSTSESGRQIFTHMPVTQQYLRNLGITPPTPR
ncbi:MAG: RHS repeat-associated core domain-containing protein [Pyrinomonadaceae bacterium]